MTNKEMQPDNPIKMSTMILEMAEDYIQLGETLEARENLLRSACSAWNIACEPHKMREDFLQAYMSEFRAINKAPLEECKELEYDMRKLLKIKLRLFPHIKKKISFSKIIDHGNNNEEVIIGSIREE